MSKWDYDNDDPLENLKARTQALDAVKALILSDPARMAALGIKDERELGELSTGALYAYGAGAGIDVPPIWPSMKGKT
jgi:hypothetical protein